MTNSQYWRYMVGKIMLDHLTNWHPCCLCIHQYYVLIFLDMDFLRIIRGDIFTTCGGMD